MRRAGDGAAASLAAASAPTTPLPAAPLPTPPLPPSAPVCDEPDLPMREQTHLSDKKVPLFFFSMFNSVS